MFNSAAHSLYAVLSIYNRKKILQYCMLQAAKEANIQVGAGLAASTAVSGPSLKMLTALCSVAAAGTLLAGYYAGNAIYAHVEQARDVQDRQDRIARAVAQIDLDAYGPAPTSAPTSHMKIITMKQRQREQNKKEL